MHDSLLQGLGQVTVGLAIYLFVSSLYVIIAGRPAIVQLLRGELANLGPLPAIAALGPRHRALLNVAFLLGPAGIVDSARHARTRGLAATVACTSLLLAWAPGFRVEPFPDLHWPMWAARLEQKLRSGGGEPLTIPSYPATFEIIVDGARIDTSSRFGLGPAPRETK